MRHVYAVHLNDQMRAAARPAHRRQADSGPARPLVDMPSCSAVSSSPLAADCTARGPPADAIALDAACTACAAPCGRPSAAGICASRGGESGAVLFRLRGTACMRSSMLAMRLHAHTCAAEVECTHDVKNCELLPCSCTRRVSIWYAAQQSSHLQRFLPVAVAQRGVHKCDWPPL